MVTRKCDFIFNSLVENLIRINPNERPESKQIDEKLHYINSFINKAIKTDTDAEFLKSSTILTNSESDEKFYTNLRIAVNSFDRVKTLEQNKLKDERFKKLEKYMKQEISKWESLNPKDSRTLFYLENICCIYYFEKDREKCLESLKAFMEKTEELFPGNTAEKAKSLGRAGFNHLFLFEDFQKAAEFYMKALEIRKKLLSEVYPTIANTYHRLGQCYLRLNLIQQALDAFFKALELRSKIYEEKSEFIVDTLSYISECYLKLNDSDQYTKYRRKALEIKKSLFAAENIDREYKEVLIIRGNANGRPAWHYLLIEDDEKYQKLKKTSAGANIDLKDYGNIIKSGFGEDSPSYIDKEINRIYGVKYSSKFDEYSINGNLVKDLVSDNIENEDPVLNWLFESLKFNYNLYNGIENIEIVKDLLTLTDYYYMKLNNAYCCNLLATRAREISLRLFDNKETEYSVNALNYVAGCHLYISKKFENALDLYNKVLEIRKGLYDPDHPFIASALFNLGVCYIEIENYEEALKYLQLCLEIRKRIYSPLNTHIRYTLDRIKDCYEKLNNKENFLKYYMEVLKIKKELYKKNHPDKEYKDVFLVRGNDKGRPAWHYILIENEEKYLDLIKQKEGTNIDVTNFGRIIKSGWGINPSKEVVNEIKQKYDYEID